MDFMRDTLHDSRAFRTLHIVDAFTRECLAIEVDVRMPGERVVRVLEQHRTTRGLPARITVDNGPEFQSRALDAWAHHAGVDLQFSRPGKPVDNTFIEAFNGRVRDECLNQSWFLSLADARRTLAAWRELYNTARPHRAHVGRTPVGFATDYHAQVTPTGLST
jgi:putative transposase